MERSYEERASLYFYRRNRYAILLLLVLGFALGSAGYHRGGSHIFLYIGAAFAAMALWLWVRQRTVRVTGSEVDDAARRRFSAAELRRAALKELALAEEDVEGLRTELLQGYSPLGIKTEPLFRWDSQDERARSSNYQSTYVILDERHMYTYTEVRSLVDGEFYRGGRIWRFDAVAGCSLEAVPRLCMTAPEKEAGKVERPFRLLTIRGENGEKFGFAFGDTAPAARLVAAYITERIQQPEGAERSGTDRRPADAGPDIRSRRGKRAAEIGTIGDRLSDL